MNTLDFVLLAPLGFAAYRGFKKGLLFEILILLALVGAVYFGFRCARFVAEWLAEKIHYTGPGLLFVALILVFFGILIGMRLLAKYISKSFDGTALGVANKLGGLGIGLLKAIALIQIVLYLLFPIRESIEAINENSRKTSAVYAVVETISNYMIPFLNDFRDKLWEKKQA